MKKPPFPETVIVISGDQKKMAKYVDFDKILVDTDGNPIVRVVHVLEDKKKKEYYVGVRFLERPSADFPVSDREQEKGIY
jgi:hypothetical protein